jgi:riboflavin biosynthesis pyrimidine reductase
MELPAQAPLFADPGARIVVLTSSKREPPPCAAQLEVERFAGEELDFVEGMRRLRERHGVRSVLLEGGPTLLAAMTAAGVVDELFLTLSPLLAGSADAPTILEGTSLANPRGLELRSLLEHQGFLFLRYGIWI